MERLYKIEQLLSRRTSTSRDKLVEELGVSWSTLKRDLEYLRNRFNAPVVWDRDTRGYKFGKEEAVGPKFQLPGLWFDEEELLARALFAPATTHHHSWLRSPASPLQHVHAHESRASAGTIGAQMART